MATLVTACHKDPINGILNFGNYNDTSAALKATASFPIGAAVIYDSIPADAAYAATLKQNFNIITPGNEMKMGSIVQLDGTKNYTKADALVNYCVGAGLNVYGHTLAWYQQQPYAFLTGLAAAPAANTTNILGASGLNYNPDFDNGGSGTTPASLAYWWYGSVGGGGSATFSLDNTAGNVEDGTYSLKAVVTTAGSASYSIQFINQDWKPTTNQAYVITFWAKSAGSGNLNVINQTPNAGSPNFASQTVTPTTTWTKYTWNYTAPASSIQFGFQFPTAGTFWIDNVSISLAPPAAPAGPAVTHSVDSVFHSWINGIVTRYKANVHAWDAVNEALNDDGTWRNGTNGVPDPINKYYYWGQYLGRAYIDSAFSYAHQADPTADLFLNDYNLETSTAKVDSFVALAKGLKSRGSAITGVGTQFHISWNTTYAGIDAALQKLASTGLKVRISELDIKINPLNKTGFVPNQEMLQYQADMYHYVVQSYLKNVPVAQQFGITIWGIHDADSWLYKSGTDFPLMFDNNYARKPAYAGFLQALKGQ